MQTNRASRLGLGEEACAQRLWSALYGNGFDQRVVHFCFAKKDTTLHTARGRRGKL